MIIHRRRVVSTERVVDRVGLYLIFFFRLRRHYTYSKLVHDEVGKKKRKRTYERPGRGGTREERRIDVWSESAV